MPAPHEIELKLEVEAGAVADLKARVLAPLGHGGGTERLVSVYYDTPDHALDDRDMTLRVRMAGGRRVQTVKRARARSAGLFAREEWEAEIDGEGPDLDAAGGRRVRRVLARAGGALEPVFETLVERTNWVVEADGARVEIALDEGRVVALGRSEPLAELELELKGGSPIALFDLLHRIGAAAPLRIGVLTKSERGYRLLRDKPPRPAKATPVVFQPGTTAGAAFQAILRACLRQFRLNEPLLVQARQPEALHQARVALRRLRSALSLFEPVVADAAYEGLKSRLRDLSRELGEARNLDVYLERSARPAAERAPDEPGVHAFLEGVEARRAAAYDRLIAHLSAPAFPRLMLDLLLWCEAGDWAVSDEPLRRAARERPVEAFAAALLGERRRKVKKKGRDLRALDPHERHRVRIQAKKLRYAAEFFASLPEGGKARHRHAAFIAAMETFQQHLGDLNDIQTGHDLALDLAAHPGPSAAETPEAAYAAGHVSGAGDARTAALLDAAAEAYRSVMDAPRFWRRWAAGQGRR